MRYVLVAIFVLLVSIPLRAEEPAAKELHFQAGAATSNITPPIGGLVIGGFIPTPSKHVHDELHARCLVLDDGKVRLALVVCDLLGIHRDISDEARKLIQENVGIPRERVLICATHTHSATSALGDDRYKEKKKLDDYQQFVARRIADGVQRAANNLRPAEFAFGTSSAPDHVFNRRWYMKPGTVPPNPFDQVDQVKMNPPSGPNLVEPAGPTDPNISILALREPDGKPIALFASYSLHYVGGVPGTDISADYYGMFSRRMESLLGDEKQDPPFVAMMANGTSGDVNNINFRQPRGKRAPYEQMRFVADDVAAKVHSAWKDLKFQTQVSLDFAYREVPIGARRPTAEEMTWAKQTMEKPANPTSPLPRIYAERTLKMAEQPETFDLPLQVLRIGDVGIATMPCEVFCEIGLEFKKRGALQPGFLVSLSHGYYGYLPTPRQHRLGGYETWLGTNRLEMTASDKMLAALLEMTEELKAKGSQR